MLKRQRATRKQYMESDAGRDLPSSELDAEELLVERELEAAVEQAIGALDRDSAEAILALLGRGPKPEITAVAYRKRISRAYDRMLLFLRGFYA